MNVRAVCAISFFLIAGFFFRHFLEPPHTIFSFDPMRIGLNWLECQSLMSSHLHQHFLEHPLKTGAFLFSSSFAIFFFFHIVFFFSSFLEKLVNYCKQATEKKFNAF